MEHAQCNTSSKIKLKNIERIGERMWDEWGKTNRQEH